MSASGSGNATAASAIDAKGRESPRGRRKVLRALASFLAGAAPLLLVFLGLLHPAFGLATLAVWTALVFWWLRTHIPTILVLFLLVFLSGIILRQPSPRWVEAGTATGREDSLIQRWSSRGSFREELPVVFHLVFDELMSPGGMDTDLPGAAKTRREMYEFAERDSFRVFDSVYSRHFFSGVTLPSLMTNEYRGRSRLVEVETEILADVADNAYFDDMAALGYRTVVFQTSNLNFCRNPNVDLCETFKSFDPAGGEYGPNLETRTAHLWNTLLRSYNPSYISNLGSYLLGRFYGLGDREVGVLGVEGRFDVQRFPDWFDRFGAFAAQVPRGTHVFAHFMVPHSPYLLTDSCVVSGVFESGYYLADRYETEREREKARRHYYEQYFDQVRCVQRKLDDMIRQFAKREQLRDALIIIHGDHGSRISAGSVLEGLTRRGLVDNYATYFAVKGPGVEPGVDCELMSLSQAFRRYVPTAVAGSSDRSPLPVLVTSDRAGGAAVEVAMPEFGCAREPRRKGS